MSLPRVTVSILPLLIVACTAQRTPAAPHFDVTIPASAHAQPITGRVFVMLSKTADSEPRLQVGGRGDRPPLYAVDVSHPVLRVALPHHPAAVRARTLRRLDRRVGGEYTRKNWSKIGPQLVGKLHFIVGDRDNYWLNLAVYRMQALLDSTQSPAARATFTYGRPVMGHGFRGETSAQLIRDMYKYMTGHGPILASR